MQLLNISIDNQPGKSYIFHNEEHIQTRLKLYTSNKTEEMNSLGSSLFYMGDRNILVKMAPDKYKKRLNPLKWFFRDYLEKRLLLQFDARKEFKSLNILKKAGLKVPKCYGWGGSLNPFNSSGSVFIMGYLEHAVSGGKYFESLDEHQRYDFLDRLSVELSKLVDIGYYNRDLHYDNMMISDQGEIIWIDTHVKALPLDKENRWGVLNLTLVPSKLAGERYSNYLKEKLHSIIN